MYFLGLDIGSSSIKGALVDAETGRCVAKAAAPETEMRIVAPKPGWAEQNPEEWWTHTQTVVKKLLAEVPAAARETGAIGIAYQMHGLVCLDKTGVVLRPSIIWCDSRAVETGERAFRKIGEKRCLEHHLNSPGNFTAAKLAWVMENEPEIYAMTDKILLPGEYIAYCLTGRPATTVSGLSEGIFWDYREKGVSTLVPEALGIDAAKLPEIVPTFGFQGELAAQTAEFLGLRAGIPVTYRAGDQPNNALSLNVLNPGEVAATAGTSGVVYGVSGVSVHEPLSRVNPFVHVTNTATETRNGILLCINGTGIQNSWMKKIAGEDLSYDKMNKLAQEIPPGSEGIRILPFGNGAERMLGNRNIGASIHHLNFNIHGKAHLIRAAQEGIAFAFHYGMSIMKEMGVETSVIRAGKANMFLSRVFGQSLSDISGAEIELYNTDGACGAALGAGIGLKYYKTPEEAFRGLECVERIVPERKNKTILEEAFGEWEGLLEKELDQNNL
jgi:xylulokinase